jgi:signal transduction histidine kinase
MSIGKKLSVSITVIFGLFAFSFMAFQHYREKEFKIECLNIQLQDCNLRISESLSSGDRITDSLVESYVFRHEMDNLRVTIIDSLGRVLYDNRIEDYSTMDNHLHRKEIREALDKGQGTDIERTSATMGQDYFYSATYIPQLGLFIRSALPYNHDLKDSLRAEKEYIWLALAVFIVLTFILSRFTRKLGNNINKLRTFAKRIALGESLEIEELAEFSNDELGEIAERIVKIYKKLQITKEEQNKLKRELTQNAAHELKTPVASIQGYLETILTHPDIPDEMRQQFLVQCFSQAQRMTAILQDISTLNKIDEAPVAYEFNEVDISQIVGQIVDASALHLKEHRMHFDNKLPSSLLAYGDASLIHSIFRNLTDNAISYAGDGSTITLTHSDKDTHWQFIFSDNGVGIAAEHLPRIFERFYRVDKGRSRKLGGTGLGLAIVKNAVQLHDGMIAAFQNKDGGVRFVFTIRKCVGHP